MEICPSGDKNNNNNHNNGDDGDDGGGSGGGFVCGSFLAHHHDLKNNRKIDDVAGATDQPTNQFCNRCGIFVFRRWC